MSRARREAGVFLESPAKFWRNSGLAGRSGWSRRRPRGRARGLGGVAGTRVLRKTRGAPRSLRPRTVSSVRAVEDGASAGKRALHRAAVPRGAGLRAGATGRARAGRVANHANPGSAGLLCYHTGRKRRGRARGRGRPGRGVAPRGGGDGRRRRLARGPRGIALLRRRGAVAARSRRGRGAVAALRRRNTVTSLSRCVAHSPGAGRAGSWRRCWLRRRRPRTR